jgi:hypothetical protein
MCWLLKHEKRHGWSLRRKLYYTEFYGLCCWASVIFRIIKDVVCRTYWRVQEMHDKKFWEEIMACFPFALHGQHKKLNSEAFSGEVSANFCGWKVPRGQRDGSIRPYSWYSRPEPLLFLSSSSSIALTRLSGPRSRPTNSQKICNPMEQSTTRKATSGAANREPPSILWNAKVLYHIRNEKIKGDA